MAGLPGQESSHSLVDILYGTTSPSGKLPFTITKNKSNYGHLLNSTVTFDAFPQDNFTEGFYIDYRAFDRDAIEPHFEFGFGLTYSTFEYGNSLHVESTDNSTSPLVDPSIPIVQGGHPTLWDTLFVITTTLTNTGSVTAAEVAQLYLQIPNAPVRQLRGFEKVMLQPGESVEVQFSLTRRDLSIWDVMLQQWRLQEAEYGGFVGSSSRDLRVNGTVVIE